MGVKSRKICILGSSGVGKSAVSIQFVEGHFMRDYNPTIENTFEKKLRFRNSDYQLQILDTAALDETAPFPPQYGQGVDGYVFVYSVLKRHSFDVLESINDRVLNIAGTNRVPRVVVGNKIDLPGRLISTREGEDIAKRFGCSFVECSAVNFADVEKVFLTLLDAVEGEVEAPEPKKKSGCIIL